VLFRGGGMQWSFQSSFFCFMDGMRDGLLADWIISAGGRERRWVGEWLW
jgi:hypothetical protein